MGKGNNMENEIEAPIKVHISGSTVYRAVANYLNHSQEFKDLITRKINELVTEERLVNIIDRQISQEISLRWNFNTKLENMVKTEIKAEVKNQIKDSWDKDVLKTILKGAIEKSLG
jgi:hypothetical protein